MKFDEKKAEMPSMADIFSRHLHYYVPLDNTYVIMQMIATFIILITGIIVYLLTYKSTIIDPIEEVKNLFMNAYLAIIVVLVGITLGIHFFSKNENVLMKRLLMTFSFSIIIMLVFWGIKFNLDCNYTANKFEEFFEMQEKTENSDDELRVDIGLTSVSLKTEKEYYLSECKKLYNIFKVKTSAMLGIHFLLNILLIYQIIKISTIQGKKDKLNKDDLILFDEEQNVRF